MDQLSLFATNRNGSAVDRFRKSTNFAVHTTIPEDFGQHYEDSDHVRIREWLLGNGTAGYEVSMWDGKNPIGTLTAQDFIQMSKRIG